MQFRLYSVIFFIYDKKNNVSVRIGGVLYGYTVVLDERCNTRRALLDYGIMYEPS